jgi:hypothetical protein
VGADVADPYTGNACVECHRDLPGKSSQIVELDWKQSVHYEAQVACDGCHGGNPNLRADEFDTPDAWKRASHIARDPDFLLPYEASQEGVSVARGRAVSYFCGKCHAEIKEKHLGSPHGDFGDPTCLFCHGGGSHRIGPASVDLIDTRSRAEKGHCSRCHKAGTMESVARIKKLLIETEKNVEESERKYAMLEMRGYRNLELEQLAHHTEEVHSKLRRVFHSFNMGEINNFVGEIEEVAGRIDVTADVVERMRRAQRQQAIIGLGVVVFLLLFARLLVYYKHAFLED